MHKYNQTSRMAVGIATAAMLFQPSVPVMANTATTGDIYSMAYLNQAAGGRPAMSTAPANAGIQADVGFADSTSPVHQPSATAYQSAADSGTAESVRQSTSGQPQSAGSYTEPAGSGSGSKRKGSTTPSYSSGKSAKEVVVPTLRESATDTGPVFGVIAGWDSRMVYHGNDWIARGTGQANDSESAGIWYTRATMEWQGIAAYVGYLQSDQKVNPRDVRVQSEFYSEIQAGVSYTYGVVPNILDATVGYNAYFINSEAFLGHSYNGEVYARLAYRQIPFITPSISVFYLHGDNGSVVLQPGGPVIFDVEGFVYEARIDGNFKLFNLGSEGFVALNPHITLNVDGGYWTAGAESFDVINLQYGLNIPIVFNKNLSLNLHVNYYQPIQDRTGLISHPDVWGGASIAYKF